ncbi:hypothetical protein, partial [Caballeronia sp. ATUFL_M2_KS44]|uniref:hypothetical protein n=1 Tax=Caballeronia sp. ATUFL_M2_KS44 TaxID=2921767 RepID=UPI00202935AD
MLVRGWRRPAGGWLVAWVSRITGVELKTRHARFDQFRGSGRPELLGEPSHIDSLACKIFFVLPPRFGLAIRIALGPVLSV